ncbi:hypothetical protein ElyMa_006665900 [Elysia marginata]|uniref:Uncharacterized protein n=1 Tax=Elysia marginata TaxID=1093978 RepID=A0AAV4IM31_9GAST|nr:hypothetical protein ElyMa_006665900 [Elysia marginata]
MEKWTQSTAFLCAVLVGFLVVASTSTPKTRLDVFDKLSDGNNTLSVQDLQTFVDGLIKHLKCEEHGDDHGNHGHGDHDDHDHGEPEDQDHGECQKFMMILGNLFNSRYINALGARIIGLKFRRNVGRRVLEVRICHRLILMAENEKEKKKKVYYRPRPTKPVTTQA